MFTKRIIPYLDVNNGRVVKDMNFVNLRDAGGPMEIVAAYDKTRADELVSLNIAAPSGSRRTMVDMVRKMMETVFTPFIVGDGICTMEDFHTLLREDVDKISINSSAIDDPRLISDSADKFDRQCVAAAIDARRRTGGKDQNIYEHDGRMGVGIDAPKWIIEADRLGAGEILLANMDCDGTRDEYDNELTSLMASHVSVPVIASGGVGNKEHFYGALTRGGMNAVLAASSSHYKEPRVRDLKKYLSERGTAVGIWRKGWNAEAGGFNDGSKTGSMVSRVKYAPVSRGWRHMGRSG